MIVDLLVDDVDGRVCPLGSIQNDIEYTLKLHVANRSSHDIMEFCCVIMDA